MAELRLTRDARADLSKIRRFSKERFGAATAKAYLQGFNRTFAVLLERPLIGSSRSDLAPGVRAFSHRSHRIYFRVIDEDIQVLRILHHAQSDVRAGIT